MARRLGRRGNKPDLIPPSIPTSLVATPISSSQIDLSWGASTDNVAVTGYAIYRNSGLLGFSITTSYSDTGLTASTSYSYTVKAFDVVPNLSGDSNTATATTQAAAQDTTPPSAPTNLLAAAISSSQINLTWTASTDNVAVTGYRIYRNNVLVGSPAATSYSDAGLVASTTYTYTAKAIDAIGNLSAVSNSSQATTNAPPAAYTGPTPSVATKAQWDSAYTSAYGGGGRTPAQGGAAGADNFHWAESYMLRAYLNMARTYGITTTDYLARCVTMIDAWQNYTTTGGGYRGWDFATGVSAGVEQGFLDTGGCLAAIMEFCYVVLNDATRFSAYTSTATTYLSRYISGPATTYPTIMQFNGNASGPNLMTTSSTTFLSAVNNIGWYQQSGFGPNSVKPNNQGALMGIASLLAYKCQQFANLTPTAQLLTNATNCALYLRAQINATSGMGSWGANKPSAGLCDFPYGCTSGEASTEDCAHGHIQIRAMYLFEHFGLGGFSASNKSQLNGTLMNVVASGQYITTNVDGTGGSIGTGIDSAHTSVLAVDWPDLSDYASFDARMTKIVQGYNFNAGTNPDWRFLGWSTIQRKLAGVSLY